MFPTIDRKEKDRIYHKVYSVRLSVCNAVDKDVSFSHMIGCLQNRCLLTGEDSLKFMWSSHMTVDKLNFPRSKIS
jgi:hypothetical protein